MLLLQKGEIASLTQGLGGHRLKTKTWKGDHSILRIMRENRFLSASRIRVDMMTSSNGNIFALLAISAGNSSVSAEFPAQSQWRGALMFSLICAWIQVCVNNGETGNLRHHRAPYDVIVMWSLSGELDVVPLSVRSKICFVSAISLSAHPDRCPNWLLIIAPAACWHAAGDQN